jgi:hypothetical protein
MKLKVILLNAEPLREIGSPSRAIENASVAGALFPQPTCRIIVFEGLSQLRL